LFRSNCNGKNSSGCSPSRKRKCCGIPDHLPRLPIYRDRLSYNRPVAPEAPLPIAVSQHHRFRRVRRHIGTVEPPSQHRRHTQYRQHPIRHIQCLHLLGTALLRHRDRIAFIDPNVLEHAILLAINKVIRRRHIHFVQVQSRCRMPHSHQCLRMWIRQRLQQHPFHYAEHRNVRAHPRGQRDQRDNGEQRRTPKPAQNLFQLARHGIHFGRLPVCFPGWDKRLPQGARQDPMHHDRKPRAACDRATRPRKQKFRRAFLDQQNCDQKNPAPLYLYR
jgi:hypothetical protein